MPVTFGKQLRGRLALASAQSGAGTVPGPSRRSVSRFPPLTDKVEALPIDERILLRLLAEWVVETHEPGLFPVVKITCIGHADRDFQRGKGFEQAISERRARAVLEALSKEIRFLSGIVIIQNFVPIPSRIQFSASGVGSAQHKPAVNEKQRLRNRRVEIIFERGQPNRPPPVFFDIIEATKRAIRSMPQPPLPLPRPDFFTKIAPPPKKDEWREFITFLRKKTPLRFVDLKSVTEGIIDAVSPPENPEEVQEKWAESLLEALIDDENERRNRTIDPPGDPDDEDEDTEAPETRNLPPKIRPIQQQR
jgi:hypothetical protein